MATTDRGTKRALTVFDHLELDTDSFGSSDLSFVFALVKHVRPNVQRRGSTGPPRSRAATKSLDVPATAVLLHGHHAKAAHQCSRDGQNGLHCEVSDMESLQQALENSNATLEQCGLLPKLLQLVREGGHTLDSPQEIQMRIDIAMRTGLLFATGGLFRSKSQEQSGQCHYLLVKQRTEKHIRELLGQPTLAATPPARMALATEQGPSAAAQAAPPASTAQEVRVSPAVEPRPASVANPTPPQQASQWATVDQLEAVTDVIGQLADDLDGVAADVQAHGVILKELRESLGVTRGGTTVMDKMVLMSSDLTGQLTAIGGKLDALSAASGRAPAPRAAAGRAQPPPARRDLQGIVRNIAKMKLRPLAQRHAAIVATEAGQAQVDRIMGLPQEALAALLKDVAGCLKDVYDALATHDGGIYPDAEGFDPAWLLDDFVSSALVAGLTYVPTLGEQTERRRWLFKSFRGVQKFDNPCLACGVSLLKGQGRSNHPQVSWVKQGKSGPFPSGMCRPQVKDCLCSVLFSTFESTTGCKVPKAARGPHRPRICPLGEDFARVAQLAEWVQVAPVPGQGQAGAAASSPLVRQPSTGDNVYFEC